MNGKIAVGEDLISEYTTSLQSMDTSSSEYDELNKDLKAVRNRVRELKRKIVFLE